MEFQRIIVGLSLTTLALSLINFRLEWIGFLISKIAVIFDIFYTLIKLPYKNIINLSILINLGYLCITCLSYLEMIYQKNPSIVVLMITIVQLSDVCQYVLGRRFGQHYIGWISPKKTYEGYILSYFVLFLLSIICNISIIYTFLFMTFGICGGIAFSIIKRKLGIKDWSFLLGSHGGFLDRTDSLYFSILYLYFFQ